MVLPDQKVAFMSYETRLGRATSEVGHVRVSSLEREVFFVLYSTIEMKLSSNGKN